jgi:arylsulfatase A-like enzyme
MEVDPHDEAGAGARPEEVGADAVGAPAAPGPEPAGAPVAPAPAASLRALLGQDVRRCARVLAWGCAALAVFETAAALIASPAHDTSVLAAVRLVFLSFALLALLWLMLVPLVAGGTVAIRLLWAAYAPARAHAWRGFLAPAPAGAQPATAWLWAGLSGALVYITASAYVTFRAITYFKEPQLTALLLAIAQLVLFGLGLGVALAVKPLATRTGAWLDSRLGRLAAAPWLHSVNPLTRVGPALVAMLLLGTFFLSVAALLMPQLAPKIPWRHLLALGVLAAGLHAAESRLAHVVGQRVRALAPLRRRGAAAAGVALGVVLFGATLLWIGADQEAKSVATTGSPLFSNLVDVVRKGTDFDNDGFGFLLGENDCAPLSAARNPLARDIPDNGIDEDCNGRDFSFRLPASYQPGSRLPVPDDFRRSDWNILLVTIDTVRYDHTGFGGYLETKKRDTTPNLDQLVQRSVSFTFANAPSAGTVASVPAILTSKFFHSGIALDENVPPRTPPRLKPENLLISEIAKSKGYRTGAVLTHVYFKDWGMQQGFDTFDNELGAKYEPSRVTSHDVTDKAIAWIAGAGKQKWFLWLHYIDPHGYYVDHPGEPGFGTTEEDRYDGELRYTDKHLGRLLAELTRMPDADRTIVFVTSDHGDAFNEHGFINHGQALYRELLHVPMIVYVPGLPPRAVDGATSPLDVVPTIADLIGYSYEPGQFEGESLIPQLFYGKDAKNRVVFAETDWPDPLRAAVTVDHKLVYKLKRNLYELYDLRADPWEKKNIATRDKAVMDKMKRYLDEWLERVYYARDALSNQQITKLRDLLLTSRPTPRHPTPGVTFDGGRIEILGFDTDKDAYQIGDEIVVSVYFHVPGQRPTDDFQLQTELWQPDPTVKPVRSSLRHTAKGVLPTSRWRTGEYIRDNFTVRVPKYWKPGTIVVGLGMSARESGWQTPTGPTRDKDKGVHVAMLGEVPLNEAQPGQPEQPAPTTGPGQPAPTTGPGQTAQPWLPAGPAAPATPAAGKDAGPR